MTEKSEIQRVSGNLAQTINKLSREIRNSEQIQTDKVVALAKLVDAYEKIRKLTEDDWDMEEFGDPTLVKRLENDGLERAERARKQTAKKEYTYFGRTYKKPRLVKRADSQ